MDKELKELVAELVKEGLTKTDAYHIAVKIQKNDIMKENNRTLGYCFGLNGQGPAYLEALAMTLGYGDTGCKIAEAIRNISNSIADDLSTSISNAGYRIAEGHEADAK